MGHKVIKNFDATHIQSNKYIFYCTIYIAFLAESFIDVINKLYDSICNAH